MYLDLAECSILNRSVTWPGDILQNGMIPSPRITATPKLLLPLNNKLLGNKIKHTMSNSEQSRPRLCPLTRKIVHWCREECDNHDSSWQFVTCDDGPVTHHPPPACWQTIQSRTSNLTSKLTRVFMCRCSVLPFHSAPTHWTIPIWLNVTQGSISPLSQNTVLLQMLKLY